MSKNINVNHGLFLSGFVAVIVVFGANPVYSNSIHRQHREDEVPVKKEQVSATGNDKNLGEKERIGSMNNEKNHLRMHQNSSGLREKDGKHANRFDAKGDDSASGKYAIRYKWSEKPKIGDSTLKVFVFNGKKRDADDTEIEVIVSYDMPSMRGHHSASQKMKKNSRGEFLLPIHFAMQGEWEVVLSVQKNGEEVSNEKFTLKI